MQSSLNDTPTPSAMNLATHPQLNTLLVWIESSDDNIPRTLAQLRSSHVDFVTYTDCSQAIDFVEQQTNAQVRVVIDASCAEQLIPCVHDLAQVHSIYICGSISDDSLEWTRHWGKVKDVWHHDIGLACEALLCTIQQPFQNDSDITMTSALALEPSFMYTQLLKNALLDMQYDAATAKQSFVSRLKAAYDIS
jgi:hypothetical protein